MNYVIHTTLPSRKREISKQLFLLFPLTIKKSQKACSLLIDTFFWEIQSMLRKTCAVFTKYFKCKFTIDASNHYLLFTTRINLFDVHAPSETQK